MVAEYPNRFDRFLFGFFRAGGFFRRSCRRWGQTLRRVVANEKITITPTNDATPSPPSPLTAEVLGPIEQITEAMWPGVPVIPTMSTGATDGLYLRQRGIPVYGVSGIFSDVDDVRAHGQDERILVGSFNDGLEFLYRLTKALTSPVS